MSSAAPSLVEDGLSGRVVALARQLRAAGISVSAAEILDAVRSLTEIPLEDREVLRAMLASTLLKEPARRKTFDRFFDAFFPIGRSTRRPRPGQGQGQQPGSADELIDALRDMDPESLRELARERVERQGDLRPDADVSEESYVFQAMRGLNLDLILQRLQEEEVEGRGMSALQRRIIREDLEERMDAFRNMVRSEVFSALLDRIGSEDLLRRELRPPPDEIDFMWARESDLEGMRAAVAPLARKLTLQLSHRRRKSRRGRLDVRRTIRSSLSAGGSLAEPKFRRPAAGKPDIVLLCDISGSMRAFAKFTLELTYALATQFQRVRAFVFVDATDEVTHTLDAAADFATALARMESEARVVELDGQSWYGNCLEQFWRRAGREITPRTTVIVVGDARNNYRSMGVEFLHRVRERARKLYWLNPEPLADWNTGDSVIGHFAPACDAVYEVRNLRQLEAFVSQAL